VVCLLDTDIVSHIRRGTNPLVSQRALSYLAPQGNFTLSLITRYEILRGLKATNATAQLAGFEAWCQRHDVRPLTDPIIVLAADLWAGLRQTGRLIGDNDLLIAATALHHGLTLATGNTAHFSRIPGLALDDWTKP
jgi:tRNA(fMet)-specific endonuclease VapC